MMSGLDNSAALAAVAALAVAACGSSSSGGSGGSSGGKATLKLVAADYGTGPSNTSTKYWQGIVNAFHKANPSINVKLTSPWTNFDSQVQTMVQNHNYPDVTEGGYFSSYAQQGLLYPSVRWAPLPASTITWWP